MWWVNAPARARARTRTHDSRRRSLSCDPSQENQDGNPPDPRQHEEVAAGEGAAAEREDAEPGKLSNPDARDKAEKRQGGL